MKIKSIFAIGIVMLTALRHALTALVDLVSSCIPEKLRSAMISVHKRMDMSQRVCIAQR